MKSNKKNLLGIVGLSLQHLMLKEETRWHQKRKIFAKAYKFILPKLGERIMRQDFGCIIHERLFDRLDKSILDVLTFELKQNIELLNQEYR